MPSILGPSKPSIIGDPNRNYYRPPTGAERGADAGQALQALAASSGLNLLGSSGGSSSSASGAGGAGGAAGFSGGAGGASIAYPDTSAANAAIFARGKEQAGQNARASLTALTNQMAGRNMLGSGVEAAGMGEVIGRAGNGVNELIRDQTISDAQAGNDRAAQEYEGRITQRGQDISVAQANATRQHQTLQGLLQMVGGRGILY